MHVEVNYAVSAELYEAQLSSNDYFGVWLFHFFGDV